MLVVNSSCVFTLDFAFGCVSVQSSKYIGCVIS